jgi:Na+-driven multidrug efflux pump
MDRSTRYRSRNSSFPNNVPNFIIGDGHRCGGGSVLSRALGAKRKKAKLLCQSNYDDLPFSIRFCDFRIFFSRELLLFYGAKGDIMAPATIFLSPVIVSVPFLALSMMGNTIIRAEGQATFAMVSMIYSSTCKYCIRFCIYKITGFRAIWSSSCNGISYLRLFFYSLVLYI